MSEMREKAARGQTIITQGAPDRSTPGAGDKPNESLAGRPMKGSGTDTSAATKAGSYNDEVKKGNIPL